MSTILCIEDAFHVWGELTPWLAETADDPESADFSTGTSLSVVQ